MKKIIITSFAFILFIVSLTGCNKNQSANNDLENTRVQTDGNTKYNQENSDIDDINEDKSENNDADIIKENEPENSDADIIKEDKQDNSDADNSKENKPGNNNADIINEDNQEDNNIFDIMINEKIGFLSIGISDKSVIENIGEAEQKDEEIEWGSDGLNHQTWSYTEKGIVLDMVRKDENQYVNMITITSPCDYKTKMNIGIGSTREAVINAYKDEINEEDCLGVQDSIVVGSIYGGLICDFDNDIVKKIFIGAAAE